MTPFPFNVQPTFFIEPEVETSGISVPISVGCSCVATLFVIVIILVRLKCSRRTRQLNTHLPNIAASESMYRHTEPEEPYTEPQEPYPRRLLHPPLPHMLHPVQLHPSVPPISQSENSLPYYPSVSPISQSEHSLPYPSVSPIRQPDHVLPYPSVPPSRQSEASYPSVPSIRQSEHSLPYPLELPSNEADSPPPYEEALHAPKPSRHIVVSDDLPPAYDDIATQHQRTPSEGSASPSNEECRHESWV